jgi:hypothetical protein
VNINVYQTLDMGSKAVQQLSNQMGVDDFEELKERLDDQQADMQERQDFFIGAANADDNDELMDELNELEANMAEEELDVEIGAGPIKAPNNGVKVPAKQQVQQVEDDEELLAAMMH